jgi:hypothetical protein
MSTRLTPEARFLAALQQHQRVVIAGVGGSGKTTLSELVKDRPVLHTDDYINGQHWDDAPKRCAEGVPPGPVVIEGVRALATAKLLKDPVTLVIWLDQPHASVRHTPEQARAAAGRRTNFAKWKREYCGEIEIIEFWGKSLGERKEFRLARGGL